MKNNLTLKFILYCVFSFLSTNAQWQVLDGPYGVETSSAVFLDSLCFSGTINGLAVSSDNGQNWTYLTTGISGTKSELEFNEGKLIYDRSFNTNGGIISLDSGRTWNAMTSLGAFPPVKYAIGSGNIYAWCEYGFLFYSTNNGYSWITMFQPPSTNNTNCLTVDNSRIYVSKSSFGTGIGNMYFSDNLGATWDSLSTTGLSGSSHEVYQIIANGNQLFIVDHKTIYKSSDGGNTWTNFTTNLPTNYTTRIYLSNGKIYAALDNNGGLFSSDTAIASFTNINTNMPSQNAVTGIAMKNGTLFASSSAGLFKTDETNINWELSQKGIPFNNCNSIEAIATDIFVGTYKGFHVSHNNGDNFTSIPLGETTSNIYLDGADVYACGGNGLASTDSGNTWTSINFPYGYFNQNLIDFCRENNNFFGLNVDGLLKYSSNGGTSWTTLNVSPSTTVYCMTIKGSDLYLGTSSGIYRSTNNGSTWNVYLPLELVRKLKVENGYIYAMTSNSVFYSTNGVNWINTNYPGTNPLAITAKNSVLVVSPGLFYTNNLGANWYTLTAPTSPFQSGPSAICLTDYFLFAGYYDSIYRLPSNVVTANNEIESSDQLFTISPNPVKSELHIQIDMKIIKNQSAEINIIDALGRILVSRCTSFGYSNMMDLNLQNYASGIYFVSISVDGEIFTKKFIKE